MFQLNETESEEFEAGIKTMEMKRQISYQAIAKMTKKVRRFIFPVFKYLQVLLYGYCINTKTDPLWKFTLFSLVSS